MNVLLSGRAVGRFQPLRRKSWSSSSRTRATSAARSGWDPGRRRRRRWRRPPRGRSSTQSRSRRSDASFRSLRPFWRSPMIVPSPRRSRSTSASSKPSVVLHQGAQAGLGLGGVRRRRPGSTTSARCPAPDPAPQLVELGDAEPVGVEDHHDRGVRDVDAHLDHRRRHQHVERARPELVHRGLLVGRRHAPVQQAEPQAGQLARLQRRVGLLGRADLQLVGLLDQRAHHVGLPPGRRPPRAPRPTPRPRRPRPRAQARLDRLCGPARLGDRITVTSRSP